MHRLDWFGRWLSLARTSTLRLTQKSYENGEAPDTDPIFTFNLPRHDKRIVSLLEDALQRMRGGKRRQS